MNVKLAVITALVALLKVVAEAYFPQFPISAELINSVILGLLTLLGVSVVDVAAKAYIARNNLKERGIWK